MLYKTTKKLFRNTYQYKIVLVCAGAHYFRSNNSSEILNNLSKIDITAKKANYRSTFIKTQEELDYAFKLHTALDKIKDIELRVESPWISIYSNSKKDIDTLAKIDADNVKYICVPPKNSPLTNDTVIMPKMDFDYRVTLGKTIQENTAFIAWANANKKCKLTKSCIRDLGKSHSWGGTHFYISGDNNLLMAKMHLGGAISKVERIIKA
jgi:hypothetical protein